MTISLPMASDTLRCEAHVIQEAAKRAAEQMGLCLEATQDAQARIRKIEDYLEQIVDWYTPPNDSKPFPIQLVRNALELCTPRYITDSVRDKRKNLDKSMGENRLRYANDRK